LKFHLQRFGAPLALAVVMLAKILFTSAIAVGAALYVPQWYSHQKEMLLHEPNSAHPPAEVVIVNNTAVPGSIVHSDTLINQTSRQVASAGAVKVTGQDSADTAAIVKSAVNSWGKFEDPGKKMGKEQKNTIRRLLASKDFAALDALASKMRKEKPRLASGMWCIYSYYGDTSCPLEPSPDRWEKHDALLAEWVAARPGSVSALISQAEFLTNYAWQARGSGYANTVNRRR